MAGHGTVTRGAGILPAAGPPVGGFGAFGPRAVAGKDAGASEEVCMSGQRVEFLLVICLAFVTPVIAQYDSAIQGTITDRSNAAVPDAIVRVRELATGITRETTTSAEGAYRILSLASGSYEITVEKSGFQTAKRGSLPIGYGDTVKADFVLQLQAVAQQLQVTEQIAAVETEKGDVSSRLDGNLVRELPLNGRNIFNLLALQPGVIGRGISSTYGAVDAGNDSFAGESEPTLYAAGGRSETNNFTINGVSTNSMVRPGVTNMTANSESVDQVRMVTNSYSAEEGRSSGARIQVITKAGTNTFHGGASYYFQNNVLAARNVFETSLPVFRKNQFSSRFGGPIRRDRTFFYVSYEGLRQSGARGQVATVETQHFRDFVVTTRPKSIAATLLRQFPPAVYPTYNFRDLGSPAPGVNVNGSADGILDVGSAAFVPNTFRNADQGSVRIDHELRPGKDRLYGNFYRTRSSTAPPGIRTALARVSNDATYFLGLNETHIFSGRMLNEFRAGFMHLMGGPRPPARLDMPPVSVTGITGFQGFNSNQYPAGWWQGNYNAKDTLSLVRSSHSLKVGGELRRGYDVAINTNNYVPLYAVNSILDFADDEAAQVTRSVDPRTGLPVTVYATLWVTEFAFFINDDWKVRRNLTITAGLRYENFGVLTVQPSQWPRNFVPGAGDNYPQQIASGKADIVSSLYRRNNKNFAPRFGFAWDVGGKGQMAVRGGFGLAYDRVPSLMGSQYRWMPPVRAQATLGLLLGTPNFIYTLGDLSKPYLGYPVDPALQLGLDSRNGIKNSRVSLTAIDPLIANSRVHNWSLGVQRSFLVGTVVEVNYLGSGGHHLYEQVDMNRYAGDVLEHGRFTGLNPSFSSIIISQSNGNSVYHGGTVSVRRAMKDLSLQAGFTFGKAIDDVSRWQGQQWQDAWNRRAERGISSYDVPRKFTLVGVYELPFFRRAGRKALAARALGGWQMSGFAILEKGSPINITNNAAWPRGDFNADGANGDRPNAPAASVESSGFQRSDYLTGIFKVSDFPVPTPGTSGNLGRNAYRGPGFAEVNLSLAKRFALTERFSAQLRFDTFNAFNRVNLNNPVTDLNNTNFGRSTGCSTPRAFQAGLRFEF